MQIMITLDLTPENLKILEQLCQQKAEPVKAEHPLDASPFPEVPVVPGTNTQAAVPEEKPEEKKISKTDVKAVCLQLSKEGRQDFLKAAFAKFGAKKLTEVAESDYPALMEELSNAR